MRNVLMILVLAIGIVSADSIPCNGTQCSIANGFATCQNNECGVSSCYNQFGEVPWLERLDGYRWRMQHESDDDATLRYMSRHLPSPYNGLVDCPSDKCMKWALYWPVRRRALLQWLYACVGKQCR